MRDELLGLPIKDQDYVVVGTTPERMADLGYRPVGKDFPVFLHPKTHEQYALARTERKVAKGYKGFEIHASPSVTLQEDLARRDLTINAIAKDADGTIIDPFGGITDLQAGILRHIGPAFVEDPVRVLRVARFAARFDFQVASETMTLMQTMVQCGEVDALVPERVWQELAQGLMEQQPSRLFHVLRECGALARILPEVDALFGVPQPEYAHPEIDTGIHTMMVIDYAASKQYALAVRFAGLIHDLGKGTTPSEEWPRHIEHEARSVELTAQLCERTRIPGDIRDLALLVARFHGNVHRALELRSGTVADLLRATDAYRRSARFTQFLQACASDFHGRPGYEDRPYPQADYLTQALQAAASIDAGAIAAQVKQRHAGEENVSQKISQQIHAARVERIRFVHSQFQP